MLYCIRLITPSFITADCSNIVITTASGSDGLPAPVMEYNCQSTSIASSHCQCILEAIDGTPITIKSSIPTSGAITTTPEVTLSNEDENSYHDPSPLDDDTHPVQSKAEPSTSYVTNPTDDEINPTANIKYDTTTIFTTTPSATTHNESNPSMESVTLDTDTLTQSNGRHGHGNFVLIVGVLLLAVAVLAYIAYHRRRQVS